LGPEKQECTKPSEVFTDFKLLLDSAHWYLVLGLLVVCFQERIKKNRYKSTSVLSASEQFHF
jgi:hypothetical protein